MSRCAYLNCTNTSRNVSMFTFPVHDKDRLRLWIIHSGNTNLQSLTVNELCHRFICKAHFHPSCIHQCKKRCRLLGPAVPIHYQLNKSDGPSHLEPRILSSPEVLKVKIPTKFYSRNRTTEQVGYEQLMSPTSPSLFGGPLSAPPLCRMSRKCFFEAPCETLSRKRLLEQSKHDEKTQNIIKKTKAMQLEKRTRNASTVADLLVRYSDEESLASDNDAAVPGRLWIIHSPPGLL